MVYNERLDWKDDESGGTPIMAADMVRIETGVNDAHNQLDGRLASLGGVRVTDWNQAVQNGWYSADNAAANSPAADYFIGEVITYDANWVTQILYPLNGPLKFRRDRDAATWGPWRLMDANPADRPGGYQLNGTRRAYFGFGNGGWSATSATTAERNDASQRTPFVLPVATKRWRLRMANRKSTGVVASGEVPVAATINAVRIGEAFKAFADGNENGWMGTNVATGLASFVVPANGDDVVTPWVEAPAAQISKPSTFYMLNIGWTKPTGTLYSSPLGSFVSNASADVVTDLLAPGYLGQTYFNIQLEYEFEGDQQVVLALGDSNTEAFGPRYAYNMYHQRLSRRLGVPVCAAGYGGSTAQQWAASGDVATPTDRKWTRLIDGDFNIDTALVNLGTNDSRLGSTVGAAPRLVADFGADITKIVGALKAPAKVGVRDVYGFTVPPSGMAATVAGEIERRRYNTLLTGGTSYLLDTFDLNELVQAGIDNINMRTAYRAYQFPGEAGTANSDPVHLSNQGHARWADSVQLRR